MEKEIKEIFEICNDLLKVPCVIGFEKPFLIYLNEKVKSFGYETILKDDSLVVKAKTKNPKYLFSAHVDRHGLIKNENDELEYAAFNFKKKLGLKFRRDEIEDFEHEIYINIKENINDYEITLNEQFLMFKDKDKNIIKFTREGSEIFFEKVALRHLRENIVSYDFNKYKLLRYDVDFDKQLIIYGVKNLKKEDKIFMFDSKIQMKDDLFYAQIDNVISIAVLFYLLKTTCFQNDIIFTTKEEIGLSYENVIDYAKDKDIKVIVLDTSPYLNFKEKNVGFLTLRYGDENGGFDENLVNEIKNIFDKNKIPYDFKPSFLGRTELGRISTKTKGKISGATIQLPTMNYHTTCETASIKSLENFYKIIKQINS